MTNAHYVIPKLVEDTSLKRARTTITEGGQDKEVIQVTQVGGATVDAQTIADGMGKTPTTINSSSVVKNLNDIKGNVSNISYDMSDVKASLNNIQGSLGPLGQGVGISDVLGTKSDADAFPNQNGSINGRVRYISNAITTIDSNNYKTAEAAGTQSDPAWSGSGDGTVIALLKGIYNKL